MKRGNDLDAKRWDEFLLQLDQDRIKREIFLKKTRVYRRN